MLKVKSPFQILSTGPESPLKLLSPSVKLLDQGSSQKGPTCTPHFKQKYDNNHENGSILKYASSLAVGLVALSSNEEDKSVATISAEETHDVNDIGENDLVLKTKHTKCIVCGVGDIVEENSQKLPIVVYSRSGTCCL